MYILCLSNSLPRLGLNLAVRSAQVQSLTMISNKRFHLLLLVPESPAARLFRGPLTSPCPRGGLLRAGRSLLKETGMITSGGESQGRL